MAKSDELDARLLREMQAAEVARGTPLLVVDADEVLVEFAGHFGEFCQTAGFEFNLVEYSLDSAIRRPGGAALTREEITPLIWGFIEENTHRQREVPGAASALAELSDVAQVVVLTNAPVSVREQRIQNLSGLGMDYPVIVNEGGKGRALSWLAASADAPVAFVDDSHVQLRSAAKYAPETTRLHLVGSEVVRPIIGPSDDAHHHPADWTECARLIRAALT